MTTERLSYGVAEAAALLGISKVDALQFGCGRTHRLVPLGHPPADPRRRSPGRRGRCFLAARLRATGGRNAAPGSTREGPEGVGRSVAAEGGDETVQQAKAVCATGPPGLQE